MKPEMDDFQKKGILFQKKIVSGVHETVPSSFPLGFGAAWPGLGMHLVLCWKKARCEIFAEALSRNDGMVDFVGGLWKWSWDTR